MKDKTEMKYEELEIKINGKKLDFGLSISGKKMLLDEIDQYERDSDNVNLKISDEMKLIKSDIVFSHLQQKEMENLTTKFNFICSMYFYRELIPVKENTFNCSYCNVEVENKFDTFLVCNKCGYVWSIEEVR